MSLGVQRDRRSGEHRSALSEELLLEGYRDGERTVRCACGGFLTADPTDMERAVAEAIRVHQATPRHQRWWAWWGAE